MTATAPGEGFVAPFVTVGPAVQLGEALRVGPFSSLDGPVRIGDRAHLSAGVCVEGPVRIGEDARIGANCVLTATEEAPVDVGHGATLGAGTIVTPGVTIGPYAEIRPGTTLHDDVPARAIAAGSPARIVGYRDVARAAGHGEAGHAAPSAGLDAIAGVTLLELPQVADLRGTLSFAEVGDQLPFAPRRMFMQYAVPSRETRGEHAHRTLHQLLICVHGSARALVDDGRRRAEVLLDRPSLALHVPPMVWGGQYDYAPDTVLVVLASDVYDADDYIRDYDEFERAVRP